MKKTLLLLALCGAPLAASAQCLRLYMGNVCVKVPAEAAGDMTYEEGGSVLNVMGAPYALAAMDSLVVTREEVEPATMSVNYAGGEAFVEVSADVAPQLALAVTGATVSVTAAPLLQTEVTYRLSGSSAAGSFFMDGEYKARLELAGLDLTSAEGAAIDIANGKRIDVVVEDGTVNTLADAPSGSQKACFFVNGHPEFHGGGTLVLAGNANHAFASDEYTWLNTFTGTIRVEKAVKDGFHVDQYFRMDGGTLDIRNVGSDGIDVSRTKDASDEYNGEAFINGGTLRVEVTADDVKGLKTETSCTISGGDIDISVSGDGGKGIKTGMDLLVRQTDNAVPTDIDIVTSGTTYMPGDELLESKCRAIKVDGNFTFEGGSIAVDNKGTGERDIKVDGIYTYRGGEYDFTIKN